MLKNIFYKLKNLIVRSYISSSNDDSNYYPILNISYLGKTDIAVEKVSPYGLYSNPPNDLPVIKYSIHGNDGNSVGIAYSRDTRFKNLKNGEVLIGNEKTQAYIKFNEDNEIEIISTALIKITAPEIELTGNVTIDGDLSANAGSGTVSIDAAQVDLGIGGEKIARKGDPVQVNTGTGIGTITDGGTNTSI